MRRAPLPVLLLVPALALSASCGYLSGTARAPRQAPAAGGTSAALAAPDVKVPGRGRHGALTEREMQWARAAWRYFTNNYNAETGLVNAVDGYPWATAWNVADTLAALTAARELGLIDRGEFDERISKLIQFLNTMQLFNGQLPNKAYHTQNRGMVNTSNQAAETGWSAMDVGRLLIWLRVVGDRYPEYAEYIDRAVLRWNFCDVVTAAGRLQGSVRRDGKVTFYQEGRLGYEEYAALGYQAWGFNTREASAPEPFRTVRIFGLPIQVDARDPRETGATDAVESLPYLLHGLEFDWSQLTSGRASGALVPDAGALVRADAVYKVQEARFERERILTARTDHQVTDQPYYVRDTIYAAGYPWNTVTDANVHTPGAAMVATRAAFGMWALWQTPYSERLIAAVESLFSPERGWYEGRREATGGIDYALSASTNAVVLEVLLHKVTGTLYRPAAGLRYYDRVMADEFARPPACFPPDREAKP